MSDFTNKVSTATSEVTRVTYENNESNVIEVIKTREAADLGSPHSANTGQAGPWSAATPSSGEGMDVGSEKPSHAEEVCDESMTTTAEEDNKETRRIMRKIDRRILPICVVFYFFSALDRASIGNSKVAGMNAALGLTTHQYSWALMVFFFTYCIFEVPSNLCLRYFGARIWLTVMIVPWGLFMLCHGFVQNFEGLLVCRLFMGVFEAGILPGVSALLSFLYPASHLQTRIGFFYGAVCFAGAFGGFIAYGLAHIRSSSFEGWRWIFVIEGLLTMLVAIPGYWGLVSDLDSAKFLTSSERRHIQQQVAREMREAGLGDEEFKLKHAVDALLDLQVWMLAALMLCATCPSYSMALFLPTLLNLTMGYSAINAQLMSVPVYAVSSAAVVLTAWLADRFSKRTHFLALGMFFSSIGWSISYASDKAGIRYFGTYVAVTGSFMSIPCGLTLLCQNLAGTTKRSTGIAMAVSVTSISGILVANIFPADEAPDFPTGHRVNLSFSVFGVILALLMMLYLKWQNAKKAAKVKQAQSGKWTAEELKDMGDKNPYFVYRY